MTSDEPASPLDDQGDSALGAADDPLGSVGLNDRLWLRALIPILQCLPDDPHVNPRVQFAIDRLRIATCERAVRILSSDLAPPSL